MEVNQTKNSVFPAEAEAASQRQLLEADIRVPRNVLALLINMSNSHVSEIDSGIEEGLYLPQENMDIEGKRQATAMANAIYQKALMGEIDGLDGTSESSAKSTKIIVVLEGGLVQSVLTAEGGISVAIIDYDKEAGQDNGISIPQANGEMASAYASIIEPEIIDRARVAELYDVVDNHISIGDVEESLADAKKIAQQKESFAVVDAGLDKKYSGKVLGITDHHVVVSLGRSALIVGKSDIDRVPMVDENIALNVSGGKGVIDPAKTVDLGR